MLATIILLSSILPAIADDSIDEIMALKGFDKPDIFPVHNLESNYYHGNKNPLIVDDNKGERILTPVDLKKNNSYVFYGNVDKNNKLDCGLFYLRIIDDNGNIIAVNKMDLDKPFVQFRPKESGKYYLNSIILSHFRKKSCKYELTEYITPISKFRGFVKDLQEAQAEFKKAED
ncbi:MAG: hypothetical protein AAGE84_28165 [Cyanobacteria bacterium P01_G01_bin.39]